MINLHTFTGNFADFHGKKVKGTYFGKPFSGRLTDSRLDWSTRDRMFYVTLNCPSLLTGTVPVDRIVVRPSHPKCSIFAE